MDVLELFPIVCVTLGAIALIASSAVTVRLPRAHRNENEGTGTVLMIVGLAFFAFALLPQALVLGHALGLAIGTGCVIIALFLVAQYVRAHR